ncbi:deoxyribonuclease IV [bacterium]|nr:deoxyribonuclease IV [bacterium]
MQFGIHVPKQRTLTATAEYARDIGCETMQIFSGNPMSWQIGRLDPADRDGFVTVTRDSGISPVLIHTPYVINMAGSDRELKHQSTSTLIDALERAADLSAGPVVVHAGNHKGAGIARGIANARAMIASALDGARGEAALAIENGAGMGTAIGVTLEELAAIVAPFPRERVGVLLDTAHLWAMGYDLRDPAEVDRLADDVERGPGLDRLFAFHANDSLKELGARRDLHAMWSDGVMGFRALRNLIRSPRLGDTPAVFEVPGVTPEFDLKRLAAMRRRDARYGSRSRAKVRRRV